MKRGETNRLEISNGFIIIIIMNINPSVHNLYVFVVSIVEFFKQDLGKLELELVLGFSFSFKYVEIYYTVQIHTYCQNQERKSWV
jgi:hypothetical protein